MNPQFRAGRTAPAPGLLVPVTNSDNCLGVKPEGGLWTSTYTRGKGSGWTRWCEGEDFGVPHGQWQGYLLSVDPAARVVTIDSANDLMTLLQYDFARRTPFGGYHRVVPDFEKLAKFYDGMHLTDRGQWATRHSIPANLYGWDCESTVWFRWVFTKVRPIMFPVGMPAFQTSC